MERTQMRTWAEIDLKALEHNYHVLRATAPAGCKMMGVVKANAYGHGALPISRKLEELGCDYLAVACLDEAEELRLGGVTLPILILGITLPEFAGELLRLDLTQAVDSLETAREYDAIARRLGKVLKVHGKVDTGMSRLGFYWDGAAEELAQVAALPGLELEGVFTHFSDADGDRDFTRAQLDHLLSVTEDLERRGISVPLRHSAASNGILLFPESHLDMIRPGIALYGHDAAPEIKHGCDLHSVMTLKTRIVSLRELPAGVDIGYGRTYTLDSPRRIAVLGTGYADGFSRLLSNQAEVVIRGTKCPIVGRICMDMCMADVTHLPDVAVGEEAVYGGGEISMVENAERMGTIIDEVVCAVSRRVHRVYL